MPLFTYRCCDCDNIMEKFFFNLELTVEIVCDKCGGKKCERQLSLCQNATILDAKSFYAQKIKPDADRISKEINEGKESTLIDVCGEKPRE